MQPAFDSIRSSLAPITDAPMSSGPPPMPGTPGGGKFVFKPDEIRAIVKDWIDLADEYDLSINEADRLCTIDPPGDEYASEFHAHRASESGRLYRDSLIQKQEYCFTQAQKFQDALHDYLGVERQSVRDIKRAGETPLRPGGI